MSVRVYELKIKALHRIKNFAGIIDQPFSEGHPRYDNIAQVSVSGKAPSMVKLIIYMAAQKHKSIVYCKVLLIQTDIRS